MGLTLLFLGLVILSTIIIILAHNECFDKLSLKLTYMLHKKSIEDTYNKKLSAYKEEVEKIQKTREGAYLNNIPFYGYCRYPYEPIKDDIAREKMLIKADFDEILPWIFGAILIIALLGLIVCVGGIICVNSPYHIARVEASMQEEYNLLTTQLKAGADNQYIIDQIINYNQRIVYENLSLNNPWINWLADKTVANMPKIIIGE